MVTGAAVSLNIRPEIMYVDLSKRPRWPTPAACGKTPRPEDLALLKVREKTSGRTLRYKGRHGQRQHGEPRASSGPGGGRRAKGETNYFFLLEI